MLLPADAQPQLRPTPLEEGKEGKGEEGWGDGEEERGEREREREGGLDKDTKIIILYTQY